MSTAFNVFDGFSDYQVKILFQGWYTLKIWQFAVSCVALFTLAVVYHLLRWSRTYLDRQIRQSLTRVTERYVAEETVRLVHTSTTPPKGRECHLIGLYVAWWVLTVVMNALYLLLSMANMTFNPWVFLSIVLGFSTGELSVHAKINRLRTEPL